MSISYGDLTIRGRDGKRVPVTDCKLEPLNLLIPGGAPILVPKKTAWRNPSRSIGDDNMRSKVLEVEVPSADYDAESEEEDDDDTQPLLRRSSRSRKPTPGKYKDKCRKDSYVKDKAREAKHRRRAEQHQRRAEKERDEADEERGRLEKRIKRQEAYIARLRSRYETGAGDKKKKTSSSPRPAGKKVRTDDSDASATTATTATDSDGGATTDGSARVREMLANMKIRAAGADGPAHGARDNGPFTTSEDSQLLVYKKNGESWKFISEAMGRGKSELQKRFKELKASGAKIPGEDDDDDGGGNNGGVSSDAATAGDTTTDAEKAGDETTDAEKTEGEDQGSGGGDAFIGNLMGALEAIVEEKAAESSEKHKGSPAKSDRSNGAKNKQQQQQKKKKNSPAKAHNNNDNNGKKQKPPLKPPAENIVGGESGYDASASEAIDDAGTRAYIGQYAKKLLVEAHAGRVKIPEADDKFDEDDCVLLALTDSYRRTNRWLDIQSDFANVTGRLVPEEVLKWKFGESEKPEEY